MSKERDEAVELAGLHLKYGFNGAEIEGLAKIAKAILALGEENKRLREKFDRACDALNRYGHPLDELEEP